MQAVRAGAGTGIFTKRLAMIPNMSEIVALEIDWACFKKLLYNTQGKYPHLTLLQEDSRTHNPEGKFHCVFSSFSDHHIKTKDKLLYFRNVRQNLLPGGLYIVGDEFLPSYKPDDEADRERALRAYHGHIIDIAREEGHEVLASLEEAALTSGLNRQGDFKLSCEEYEDLLTKSGFKFNPPEKIGPPDRDDIGGVYVYTIWV